MAEDNDDKQNRRRGVRPTATSSSATLLPMLIWGLVLIVIGMVAVVIFA